MAITQKDRCFITDIIFNQSESFDAQSIGEYIFDNYAIDFSAIDIQNVIDELTEKCTAKPDRCDKTRDWCELL